VPRNGTGTYVLPSVTPPFQAGAPIAAASMNTTMVDLGTALTGSVARDGQSSMTGALNMANFAINNVANGTSGTMAVNFSQFPATIATTGTTTLPNGLIMKWGQAATTLGSGSVSFAAAFPTACHCVQLTVNGGAAPSTFNLIFTGTVNTSGFAVWGDAAQSLGFYWLAIGH
jgi:hypothetical protein